MLQLLEAGKQNGRGKMERRQGFYPHFTKGKKFKHGDDCGLHLDSPTTIGTQEGPPQRSCFIHFQVHSECLYDTTFAEEFIDLLFGSPLFLLQQCLSWNKFNSKTESGSMARRLPTTEPLMLDQVWWGQSTHVFNRKEELCGLVLFFRAPDPQVGWGGGKSYLKS